MNFTVNGVRYRSHSGSFAVKSRFGTRAVLLHSPSIHSRVDGDRRTALPSSADASLYGPLGRVEVCAVDRRGNFVVEDGGDYCVSTLHLEANYHTALAQRRHRDAANPGMAKRERRSTQGPRRRAPNRYSIFLGKFIATFANTSFADAAHEWHELDEPSRLHRSAADLISDIMKTGRYTLAAEKSVQ